MTNIFSVTIASLPIMTFILLNPLAIVYHMTTIIWPIYVYETMDYKSTKSNTKSSAKSKTVKTNKITCDILIKYWCIYSALSFFDVLFGTYLSIFPGYNFARIFVAWYIIKNDFYNSVLFYNIIKSYALDNNVKQINLSKIIDGIIKSIIEYLEKIISYYDIITQK